MRASRVIQTKLADTLFQVTTNVSPLKLFPKSEGTHICCKLFSCAIGTLMFSLTNFRLVPDWHSYILILLNACTQIQFSRQGAWPHRPAGRGGSANGCP